MYATTTADIQFNTAKAKQERQKAFYDSLTKKYTLFIQGLRTELAKGSTTSNISYKINFQTNIGTGYPGYFSDRGYIYGARSSTTTYGWNIISTSTARQRSPTATTTDLRYLTFNQMQTSTSSRIWEIAVPNGTYTVRVVAGDPLDYNSLYKINVEGVLANNLTPNIRTRFSDRTITVSVADGKLSITNAPGAINNKINFVEITKVN